MGTSTPPLMLLLSHVSTHPKEVLMGRNVQPTVRDLPGIKSQLESKPFVIGIPSEVWVQLLLNIPFLRHNQALQTYEHMFIRTIQDKWLMSLNEQKHYK